MGEWRNWSDARDLKSLGYYNHVGSTPTFPTMSMKKEFEIFGSKWTVEYVDVIPSENENEYIFGKTWYSTRIIQVAKRDKDGNIIPKEELQLTFLHELMHAILGTGQYNVYSQDEPHVEWLARCIYSLLQQKVLK